MTTIGNHIDLQRLKERHPLAVVVEASGIPLRGKGRVRQGPCPFHEERQASFTVYGDTQRFYCFGCGVKGDVLDFLQRIQRVDLLDAVRLLEGTVPLVPTASHAAPPPPPVVRDTAVLTAALRFYAVRLWRSPAAQRYLRRRGIHPKAAAALGLGYAPGAGLWAHLERAGFDVGAIAQSGLFLEEGERFAGRVVVPEVAGGRVVWLTARSIGTAEPRFQALPGGKPLLGRGRLQSPRTVVLTEGLFDWLVLMQWGLPACATLGGHGFERVAQAFAGCDRVYLLMDADAAGRAATEQLVALLGPRAAPASLPYGTKDVAELALHPRGREVLLGLLRQARR